MEGEAFQQKARSLIKNTLQEAHTGERLDEIVIGPGQVIKTNFANDAVNMRMSHMQHTGIYEMAQARSAGINVGAVVDTTRSQEELVNALTLTARTYRDKDQPLSRAVVYNDLVTNAAGEVVERSDQYATDVMEYGLAYPQVSRRARVMGVETSRATADIGKVIYGKQATNMSLSVEERSAASLVAKHIDKMEETGLSYFMGQGREALFGVDAGRKNAMNYATIPMEAAEEHVSNIILPHEIFRKLEVNVVNETGAMELVKLGSDRYLELAAHEVTLSVPRTSEATGAIVNSVFRHGFSQEAELATRESQDLVYQMFDLLSQRKHEAKLGPRSSDPMSMLARVVRKETDVDLTEEQINALVNRSMSQENKAAIIGSEYEKVAQSFKGVVEGTVDSATGEVLTRGVAETLREQGIIHASLRGNEAEAVIDTLTHYMPDIMGANNSDALLSGFGSRVVKSTEEGIILAPFENTEAARAVEELAPDLSAAVDSAAGSSAAAESAVQEAAARAARTAREADVAAQKSQAAIATALEEQAGLSGAYEKTKATLSPDKFKRFQVAAADFMDKNRKGIAIGAAIAGSALVARHFYKKHRENQQYESTMMLSEPEEGQRPYGAQEALLNARKTHSTSDPLDTAGVVGNLDRNKIGHSNMGPNKYNHLFRG